MKNTDVIENINRYKQKSTDKLKDQQIAYIPTIDDKQIECMVSSYILDGQRTIINPAKYLCFRLRYLRFMPISGRTHLQYINKEWPINTLITGAKGNQILHPFALFINGYCVPWDMMSIVIGYDEYYLLINLEYSVKIANNISEVKFAQIMTLPDNITEDITTNTSDKTVMSFNKNGEYDTINVSIAYNINSTKIKVFKLNNLNSVDAVITDVDNDIAIDANNAIVFRNKILATNTKVGITRGLEAEYVNEVRGITIPYLSMAPTPVSNPNPSARFDSNILTITDPNNDGNSTYDIAICVNTASNASVNNISKIKSESVKTDVHAYNMNSPKPYWNTLKTDFYMNMDRKKYYDANVKDAIKAMMSYNSAFFNETFKNRSNLTIEEYTGAKINSMTTNGELVLSRMHDETYDEFMVMLVNGSMYEFYKSIKYNNSSCIIPIQGITDSDIVEIFRFKNVDNNVYHIKINESDGYGEYLPEIINTDMNLFSSETDHNYFDYPANGLQLFPVEYTLDTNADGKIKITLANPFYYGKNLIVAYKNRFKWFSYDLKETTDEFVVNLGDKFLYCNDYQKYMVFYNGRKLGSDHYRLTLPVRDTTPFYDFNIYLTLPINAGDRLDIIYVPSLMYDISMTATAPISGDISIAKDILTYGLSTDLYMIWINGKKIPKSHISDVYSTDLKINTDEKSIRTLCITKYIPDIDILTEAYKDNTSKWDSMKDQITDIYNMLGINSTTLTDTEPNIYANAFNIRSIMYELVREQFMMNPRVDITEPFIYDYQDVDKTLISSYDKNGNAILDGVADSEKTDNINSVERIWN